MSRLIKISEASKWASEFFSKNITKSNIQYLIQYGRIKKHSKNGGTFVDIDELKQYYNSFYGKRELDWKEKLGEHINWSLSFDSVREKERTKHVHRLHPYKGKFIPQLVEYFLDNHTDNFKKEVFFRPGELILDPFAGSGTTLVQANELGLHAIGIDISQFNTLIANVKIRKINLERLSSKINELTSTFESFISKNKNLSFEQEFNEQLNVFNNTFFPSPDFKIKVRRSEINEFEYGNKKLKEILPLYNFLLQKYDLQTESSGNTFLDIWLLPPVKKEIEFLYKEIQKTKENEIRDVLMIILSRTLRSCRATTHADLATLKEPVRTPYYCKKHSKICKPLLTSFNWWKRYAKDTLKRLREFDKLRTNTYQVALTGDARTINLFEKLKNYPQLKQILEQKKIKGIFTSPPYVGLIDYHEQHAYAYELFGFERNDELEIGPLFRGKSKEARMAYIKGISQAFLNLKKYLAEDYDVFIVANDKFGMYPEIAKNIGMQIVEKFDRPVLNRVEKDKNPYSETIFHLKEKK